MWRFTAERRGEECAECKAVWRGAGKRCGGEIAGRARPVLHHDRLAEFRLQPLRQDPREEVRRAARREADDPTERPLGQDAAFPEEDAVVVSAVEKAMSARRVGINADPGQRRAE